MPDIQELIKDRKEKKFTKKSYRPWDLSGNSSSLNKENTIETESIKSVPKIIDTNTDNNEISNGYHLDNVLDNNEISNEYLIDSNKETSGYQIDTQSDIKKVSVKQPSEYEESINSIKYLEDRNDSISLQHYNENIETPGFNIEQEIIRISGKQKIIFDIVIEICSARNCHTTGPIQTASLATLAQTTIGTIKIILKRLIDKQLIIRYPGKNAKGGYINLGVTSIILEHVKNIKSNNKSNVFASDILLTHRYQKDISQDINSSSYNNITTTNLNKRHEQIPSEWEDINFDPLSHIGFSKTQIKQMIGKNEPTIVQESIYHFAYGLEYNPKFKKYEDPLNVLMGVLRKGQAWVETDYRSSIEIAQQKLLESKKAEIERKKTLEDEAFKLAFKEWEDGITEQERKELSERKKGDLTPPAAKLTIYFREHIWPLKKGEYMLF